jgi:hypothetical protein
MERHSLTHPKFTAPGVVTSADPDVSARDRLASRLVSNASDTGGNLSLH